MKTILITGANRGIGNAIAKKFLENNWQVIGTVRDSNKETNLDSYDNFQKEELEVSDFNSMDNLVAKLSNQPIDILFNNAGVMDASSMSESIYSTEKQLSDVYLINTIAPYILAEKLISNLNKGSENLVVSMSSLLSKTKNMLALHWVYGSSKSALNYAMNAFSQNYPSIKSALVRPGWVQTDMGGEQAPMTKEESAEIIFNNIINHKSKLADGTMVGPEGDITYFDK